MTEINSYLLYIGLHEDQPNDQQNGENFLIHDVKQLLCNIMITTDNVSMFYIPTEHRLTGELSFKHYAGFLRSWALVLYD